MPSGVRHASFSTATGEGRALFNRGVSLDPQGCAQLSDPSRMFTVGEAKADPTTHQTAELPPSGLRCGCSIHSEVIVLAVPIEDLQSETTVRREIEALRHMTLAQLKKRYVEVFGEETRSHHKHFLFRRIAWRIQALAEGGLSERARCRAMEIANDADLRVRAPKTTFQQDFTVVGQRGEGARDRRCRSAVAGAGRGCETPL